MYQQILDLFNNHVGECWELTDLYDRINHPDKTLVTLTNDRKVIGAATAYILQEDDGWWPAKEGDGILESAALLPDFRGKGYGKMLAQIRLDWLRQQKCNSVWASSWLSNQKHTSRGLLSSLGFVTTKFVERAWWGEDCPVCGPQACVCGAAIMKLNLL